MRALGPPLTAEETAAYVAAARGFLGVRWRHQGRDKRGVDCGGLPFVALRLIGRTPSDTIGYGRHPYRGSLERALRENLGDPVPISDMRFGDIPLMRFCGSAPVHVGIVTNYLYGGIALLHAFAQNKSVVEHRLDDWWHSRIVEVFRP